MSSLFIASILVFISWKPLGEPDPAPANLGLAVVLAIVWAIQAGFNAWQDWSSTRTMKSITGMLPENCLVLRDGHQMETTAPEIVPGDVIYIKSGNKLPADVRFIEVSSDSKFDRSVLTGESLPINGSIECTDANYLETKNIGLQGTHMVSGSGLAVVVATGDRTVFGRIAKLTNRPKTGLTTLQKDIYTFIAVICSLMVLFIVIVLILWGAWIRHTYPDYISTSGLIVAIVSVAVAFVPEGLPIALTASLTITAGLMKKNSILCKSLTTVETLGAVSVICSDKTGTLTKNNMFVTTCCVGMQKRTPEAARDDMVLNTTTGKNGVSQLRAIAGLCNAGEFDASTSSLPLHERKINGDATDQAVLRFSEQLGSVGDLRDAWRKTYDLAFNSKNKFMIRLLSVLDSAALDVALPTSERYAWSDGDMLFTMKGAPDVLMPRCSFYTDADGATQPLTDQARAEIEDIKNGWSSEGKRVILCARKVVNESRLRASPTSNEFEDEALEMARTGMTLVGLVGIVDPPRDEIPEVVRILRRAGIRFFMVTGDFALTAQAIAAECGIITNLPMNVHSAADLSLDYPLPGLGSSGKGKGRKGHAPGYSDSDSDIELQAPAKSIVLSGPDLVNLTEAQWEHLCTYEEIVFARTTPEQKLRIVKEFQARDNICAMTGDGVNDAPSLKQADIGIALGSGSDIAIEAADMVLLDSFSGIVEAVQYGRLVFDNLKKTIIYLLPAGTFSEFWPVFTSICFGLPQILSSFLMIIICCFTDCAAATALSYEQPEADLLERPPRNPKTDRLVDWRLLATAYGYFGIIECLCSFAVSYWYCQRRGLHFSYLWLGFHSNFTPEQLQILAEASSIYFVNLVIMQWFNLMCVRTRRRSIFQHPPAFNKRTQNWYLFPAILFAFMVIFIFLYPRGLQNSLGTSEVPVENFFLPVAFGLGLLLLDESRKYCVRRYPHSWIAKAAW